MKLQDLLLILSISLHLMLFYFIAIYYYYSMKLYFVRYSSSFPDQWQGSHTLFLIIKRREIATPEEVKESLSRDIALYYNRAHLLLLFRLWEPATHLSRANGLETCLLPPIKPLFSLLLLQNFDERFPQSVRSWLWHELIST